MEVISDDVDIPVEEETFDLGEEEPIEYAEEEVDLISSDEVYEAAPEEQVILEAMAARITCLVEINEANFPDPTFRRYVNTTRDGMLTKAELDACDELGFDYSLGKAANFKGIEYFTELMHLSIDDEYATGAIQLDVSNNAKLVQLTIYRRKLDSIDLSHNPELGILDLVGTGLESFDVCHNPELAYLYINDSGFTSIDVSHNPGLQSLRCYNNRLTALDLTHNPNLTEVDCTQNQIAELDLSQNPRLRYSMSMTALKK